MNKEKITAYNLLDVSERELELLALSLGNWARRLTDGSPETIKLATEIDKLQRKVEAP